MIRLLIAFIIFSGVVYYFDIDVRGVVEQSGAPQWLAEHGITTRDQIAQSATSTATSTTTSTSATTTANPR